MWRRSMASVLFGLGVLVLTAAGQQPAAPSMPAKKAADKKPADPVEALIESALANDPDVRMARAKIQLAEAELAKARQQVAVKVVTLHGAVEEARRVGDAIGVDWDRFDLEQFRAGMDVEFEHGSHDPQTDVTHDDPVVTGKIALAHMKEFPDYYERLERMEAEAEREWAGKRP